MGPMKVLLVLLVVMVAAPHIADAWQQPSCSSICDYSCGKSACISYSGRCGCCASCRRGPIYG
uniref:Paralithocin 1 n=1 Tax=Paralithodes camtschaticus TaxID=6741 RepID=AMP1_PARCM|nr:RecName: Full=Paralithocin 1; AltName: Full=P23; Flags: Precursor [Paralithodes camtschaticus]AUT12057.1 paralithocin 1 [Paralithodes camtschaticus]